MDLHILKFGGTSMGSADAIRRCCAIVKTAAQKNTIVVVVSAMSGVTNELITLADAARRKKMRRVFAQLNRLRKNHHTALVALDSIHSDSHWNTFFVPLFQKLEAILEAISAIGEVSDKTLAVVSSFGERLSSWLMHFALQNYGLTTQRLSAARVIRTNSQYLEADVDFPRTKRLCEKHLLPLIRSHIIPVVTGFISEDSSGSMTILGRGGSDYTASILGVSMRAKRIEIWTDVDGVLSADPRFVSGTKLWKHIAMDVMAEMAYGGAKVLHPKTIVAAVSYNIPVVIKNTFNPSSLGTTVVPHDGVGPRGIVVDKNQVLFHLTNPSILEGVGFINRCSSVFSEHRVPMDVCATSEITFTCSVRGKDYTPVLDRALAKMATLETHRTVAKICIVGAGIGSDATVLSRIFSVLKKTKVYTISSGASFNNITFFVDAAQADTVLQKLHATLF